MAGKNETSSVNSEWTWFAGAVVIAGVLVGVWFLGRVYIVDAVFGLKWAEIKAYSVFFPLQDTGRQYLEYIESYFNGGRDPNNIYWEEFTFTADRVGSVMRLWLSAIIGILGLVIIMRMKGNGFRQKFKLGEFITYQSTHWRALTPSARFNPDLKDERMDPSKTPLQWIHALGEKAKLTNAAVFEDHIREKIEICFVKQLGEPWRPIPKLPLHVRCLVAIFAAHSTRKPSAVGLREDIAFAYASIADTQKRNAALTALIEPYLKNEKVIKPLLERAEKHAFINTAMIRLLQYVRTEAGVLASAEFLWLKRVDRDLWYAMNDTGRQAFHVEAAGIFSHFFHETVSRRAIFEPKVEGAILGLEDYMDAQGINERLNAND